MIMVRKTLFTILALDVGEFKGVCCFFGAKISKRHGRAGG